MTDLQPVPATQAPRLRAGGACSLSSSLLVATLGLALVCAGCDARTEAGGGDSSAMTPEAQGPLRVAVTVPPLKGLLEALVPEGTQVVALMAPGRSEHGYEFSPSDLAALGRSHLVVYVGLGLEPQIHEFVSENPSPKRLALNLGEALGIAEEAKEHDPQHPHDHLDHPHPNPPSHDHPHDHDPHAEDHGEGEAHMHGIDPHVWLDPVLVAKMVPMLTTALRDAMRTRGALDPAADAALTQRAQVLLREVESIDHEYTEALKPLAGAAIVTHHAAFGRLAQRYGLKVVEVLRAADGAGGSGGGGGGEASPAQLAQVVNAIRENNVRMIFVEPQFNPATAQRLAVAAKVGLGTLDPLGSGDWFALMRANLKQLAAGLSVSPQPSPAPSTSGTQ